jgi:hypothetical protein
MGDPVLFTAAERLRAQMQSPECAAMETPQPATSCLVVAWYYCAACGLEWAEQLREGKPRGELLIRVPPEA